MVTLSTGSAPFTEREERVNTIIHALGVLFGLIAIPLLIHFAWGGRQYSILSAVIYGLCFLMTFTFSTLYHGVKKEHVKDRLEKFDRMSIYCFIAGTYTPFILHFLYTPTGIVFLVVIWALVIFGIIFELFFVKRYFIVSVFLYLLMGFMFIFVLHSFFAAMPHNIVGLILSGVLLYLVGMVFYLWKKWRYHHAIWHFMVLAASICHFAAVWFTISKAVVA